ncbi:MAG: transcriptional repressor [Lachnospiraceae bacterium]|nr:transcriptional repressor [Lachnospiraceae bacterium]
MQEYKTRQKGILLDYLKDNKDIHLTAGEIASHLREKGSPLGTTTVYRQLDKLVASGLVRKYIVDENSSACYQYITENGDCCEHFHMKCTQCGRLIHMDCSLLKKISEHMEQSHGFLIDNSKTLFYGVCEQCHKVSTAQL